MNGTEYQPRAGNVTRQKRQPCRQPGISGHVRDVMETHLPYMAMVARNSTLHRQRGEMPERSGQHSSADYKGQIVGKSPTQKMLDKKAKVRDQTEGPVGHNI